MAGKTPWDETDDGWTSQGYAPPYDAPQAGARGRRPYAGQDQVQGQDRDDEAYRQGRGQAHYPPPSRRYGEDDHGFDPYAGRALDPRSGRRAQPPRVSGYGVEAFGAPADYNVDGDFEDWDDRHEPHVRPFRYGQGPADAGRSVPREPQRAQDHPAWSRERGGPGERRPPVSNIEGLRDNARAEPRSVFIRARDEVSAWLGDEDAARRRRADEADHSGKGPADYRRSDDRICEDLNDRLADDPLLDASDITVKVEGGEVTLDGWAPTREDKRRAEDLSDRVSGVRHVQNNLRVKPPAASIPPDAQGIGGQPRSTATD
jgi:hypothetical protein